jgi:hypothetical protein
MSDDLIPVETPMVNLAVRTQGGVDFAREAIVADVVANVTAGYGLAMKDPRDINRAIEEMVAACDDFAFAQTAYYRIPYRDKRRGRKVFIRGKSKWYTDEAAIHYRHLHRTASILFDDANKRIISVTVRDLQANNAVTQTAEINKKDLWGNKVDLQTAAERSKLERNCILKLLPVAFQKRADAKIAEVVREKAFANRDRLVSGMLKYEVTPEMIGKYFGVDPNQLDPEQCVELLEIGTAIKDNIATWGDFSSGEADHVGPGLSLNDFKPKDTSLPAEEPEAFDTSTIISEMWSQFLADLKAMKAKKGAAEKATTMTTKFYQVERVDQITTGPDDFRVFWEETVLAALREQGFVE